MLSQCRKNHNVFMKKLFVLLFIVVVSHIAKSQIVNLDRVDNIEKYPGNLILKFSPLSLIDYRQSIQFAVEYKVKPRITFQNEIGYINNFMDLYEYRNDMNMKGLRTRFETRFYKQNVLQEVNGFYLAPEVFFVHTAYQRETELGRGCVDWNCDYFELKKYTINKNVFGYHFKIGYQNISYDRILMDIFGGFGVRHVFIHTTDTEVEQESVSERSDVFPFSFGPFNKGSFTRPSMSLGFKVGYLIR